MVKHDINTVPFLTLKTFSVIQPVKIYEILLKIKEVNLYDQL